MSYAAYEARQAVLLALGNTVHRSRSPKALKVLRDSSEPSGWTEGRLTGWTSPYNETPEFLETHFARLALIGLGLTGTLEADSLLRDLRDHPEDGADQRDRSFRTDSHEILREAIIRNAKRMEARDGRSARRRR